MMVHEFSKYTILYTIFCRFCGIVWHCIMSFSDMMLANVLNFRNFGMKWNCSVSKVVVPLSPQYHPIISDLRDLRPILRPKM